MVRYFRGINAMTLFSVSRNFLKRNYTKLAIYIFMLTLILSSHHSHAVTLEEAIAMAKDTLPTYKASMMNVKSTDALHNASLSPYFPIIDASAAHKRIYTSPDESRTETYDLTLSYTLFDWGIRRANRGIAGLNLDTSREDLRKTLLDLEFNVKIAFYTALAQRDILEQRTIQLQDSQKDYEIAEGRYRFGVTKLSDKLQASVRLEQSRFNLVQADGNFKKALSELSSLIGQPLDSQYDIQGTLDLERMPPDRDTLSQLVLERPEIKQLENSVKITEKTKNAIFGTFFPIFSVNASYIKTNGDPFFTGPFTEEKTAVIKATWNIFELGKFFRFRSSEYEKNISLENLNDLKRQLLLAVYRTYEDFMTASKNLAVAEEQLKQAEHNYSQALGEYKVGKGDILSLVSAESLLANAREQFITTKLNLILSKASLDRVVGTQSLNISMKQ